ncbi:Proline iminopeptidase [Porphyridium purpureum]|uniref:Proline iminopeptidase n=1 Tax=Porphyridium purpureum TaxID=35688 RepID=A0A5J4YWK5_PORPP|nr:Proline iminopeptidase [Porphyridium purpureum]|eukprot:POR3769..scf227_4
MQTAAGTRSYALEHGDEFQVPGLKISEHALRVPLDYNAASGKQIRVFARLARASKGAEPEENAALKNVVCYLQGGPGFEAPRLAENGGMIKELLKRYDAVLLLDQRGTGLSTPVSAASLAKLGSPQNQLEYLVHFRADSIVRDAEAFRGAILGEDAKWTILGQSFGGFCCVTYLSLFPQHLKAALITGGIPYIQDTANADEHCATRVYEHLVPRYLRAMDRFYSLFPNDAERLRSLILHLSAYEVKLPGGGTLSANLFLSLGLRLLGAPGGFVRLHYLLERAFELESTPAALSAYFLADVQGMIPFGMNPLYALLHEACYANADGATAFASDRVVNSDPYKHLFDAASRAAAGENVYMYGEQVFSWMFEDIAELRDMQPVMQLLAEYKQWGALYDVDALSANTVPVAATVYVNDLYVDSELSLRTAARIGNTHCYVTNQFTHGGLRENPSDVLDTLHGLLERNACSLEAL